LIIPSRTNDQVLHIPDDTFLSWNTRFVKNT